MKLETEQLQTQKQASRWGFTPKPPASQTPEGAGKNTQRESRLPEEALQDALTLDKASSWKKWSCEVFFSFIKP